MSNYTTEQYQALVAAIAQGVLVIQYADKKVTYRSQSEMLQLKRKMERELGISTGSSITYPKHRKGL